MLLAFGGLAAAQDPLPPPTILGADSDRASVQFSHAFSLQLRPDYCFHSFVMAYDQDQALTNLSLTLHFGNGGTRVAAAELDFLKIGGTFVDDRHLTFGYNASCRIDEVRIVEMTAQRGEDTLGLATGLILTRPQLTQMTVSRGLPIPENDAGDFAGANISGEADGEVKCLSGSVNLRQGPSTANAIVTTLRATQSARIPVIVLGEVPGTSWFEVETPEGRGFLFGGLLGDC